MKTTKRDIGNKTIKTCIAIMAPFPILWALSKVVPSPLNTWIGVLCILAFLGFLLGGCVLVIGVMEWLLVSFVCRYADAIAALGYALGKLLKYAGYVIATTAFIIIITLLGMWGFIIVLSLISLVGAWIVTSVTSGISRAVAKGVREGNKN